MLYSKLVPLHSLPLTYMLNFALHFQDIECSNVTTTRRQEENHMEKMYYNCNECSQFVSKGVITQCARLEIGKKG